jgi:purine-nucleoside phosphorylase
MQPSALDQAVFPAAGELERRGAVAPQALFLLGTGVGLLASRMERELRHPLEKLPTTPGPWRSALLHTGQFHGLSVWMLEDSPADLEPADLPWAEAFPVWLAAAAGAAALIHVSAGTALVGGEREALPLGSLAVIRDHINLSGRTPLVGLGETRLGPIFPDQSRVHDARLRERALAAAVKLGLSAHEAIAACTLAPSLDTPAERRFFALAGADVAVQGLATPLLAAAHAGLGTLAIVALTDRGSEPVDMSRTATLASALAPALDDWLWALAEAVQEEMRARLSEGLA